MIYVMSDIHGNMRRFRSVMKQIKLKPDDTLYVLGDAIDRYPDGIKIIRKLMEIPNVQMLLGNHEYMMLRAIGQPYDVDEQLDEKAQAEALKLWCQNGGKTTYAEWKRIHKATREKIVNFLRSLPLNADVELNGVHYRLVHGAPTEEYAYYKQFYENETHFSVWKDWTPGKNHHGDYTMVFGHSPTMFFRYCVPLEVWFGEKRIGVDCGSGFPEDPKEHFGKHGRLACLRLDDMKVFYSD